MQPLLKMDESQCYCTSFEIGRTESKESKGKSVECSSNQTLLLKLGNSILHWLSLLYVYDPSFIQYLSGWAGSKWRHFSGFPHSLWEQGPPQGKEIIAMLPPALGKEALLNGYCCSSYIWTWLHVYVLFKTPLYIYVLFRTPLYISGSIPTLNMI